MLWSGFFRRCVMGLAWLVLAWGPVSTFAGTDTVIADQTAHTLAPYVAVLEDPSGALTLADVQRPENAQRFVNNPQAGETFNFGITPSAYWFRLHVRNTEPQALQRLLEVAYARLSKVSLYRVDGSGAAVEQRTGVTEPFDARPYPHRFFVFPLTLPAQSQQTLYLRVQSLTALIVPLHLWEPQAFAVHARQDYVAQAWYLGMATAMALFNLLLFVRLRDRIYVHYVAFDVCMAFAIAAQNGLVKEFFRLESPLLSDLASTLGYSWAIAAALQFMRRMLDTAATLPRGDVGLRWLVWFFLLSPVAFLGTGQSLIRAAALVYVGAVVVALAVGLRGVWRRQRSAYFFMAAFGLLACGAAINGLRAMGLLPTNVLTTNAMQWGASLEMILLAFALADRFNEMRRDKALMQQKMLEAQEKLIENLRHSEHVLEQRVQERTGELQALNTRLAALSMTDGLTGIANRHHFDEALQREWARARRSGQPLALALIDVDWFKRYNDHYGHLAGDECLRTVAQVFTQSAGRSEDLVARYGGEEFVVLAPHTDWQGIQQIAQRIQAVLQSSNLPHVQSPFGRVSASIGLAVWHVQDDGEPALLVQRADEALYRAKAQGRNCIATVAPPR